MRIPSSARPEFLSRNIGETTPEPSSSFRSQPKFELFVLIVLPLAYLLVGPFQLFLSPGWVDPGMYLSYFLDFKRTFAEVGGGYHAMRLPFTATGYLVHMIFSPLLANYVIVLGFHYLALFSVYFAVRARAGGAAAVYAALFLGLNPLWIAALTRGYVDGPGMAFLFASLAFLAHRGRSISFSNGAMLAGVAAALSMYTNIIAGIIALVAILSWLIAERISWREWWWTGIYGIAGVVVLTLALCLISRLLLKAPFFFFSENVYFGRQAMSGFGVNYVVPRGEWMPSAYRLILPLGFFCAGVYVLLVRGWSASLTLVAGCITIALTSLWFFVWDVVVGSSTLQFAHYASYFIPGQCIVFAGLAEALLSRDDDARSPLNWIAGGLVIAATIPLLRPQLIWAFEGRWHAKYVFWIFIAALFGVAAIQTRRRPQLGLALLMFATVFAGTANADTRRIFRVGPNPDYKPFYQLMVRVYDLVHSTSVPGRRLYIWFCRDCLPEPERDDWRVVELRFRGGILRTNMLDSIAALWLWDRSILNAAMPSLPNGDVDKLAEDPKGATLMMMCPEDDACDEAMTRLHRAGLATHERVRMPLVAQGLLDAHLRVIDITRNRTEP